MKLISFILFPLTILIFTGCQTTKNEQPNTDDQKPDKVIIRVSDNLEIKNPNGPTPYPLRSGADSETVKKITHEIIEKYKILEDGTIDELDSLVIGLPVYRYKNDKKYWTEIWSFRLRQNFPHRFKIRFREEKEGIFFKIFEEEIILGKPQKIEILEIKE